MSCRSVCLSFNCGKMADRFAVPFGMMGQVCPGECTLDGGADDPTEGTILGIDMGQDILTNG